MSDTETLDSSQAVEQAARVVGEIAREADKPAEVDIDPDRTREGRTPGFSRMRTDWHAHDAAQVAGILQQAEGRIRALFPGAFLLMNELYQIVRKPVVDPVTGEIVMDIYGWPEWERYPNGAYVEDYSKLAPGERENYLHRVTTNLVEWQQQASKQWLEAMLAKGRWEEAMAAGFTAPTGRVTVEERTQRGRAAAAEYRYHAIYLSGVSRAAEALIRSLELVGQRLKDGLGL